MRALAVTGLLLSLAIDPVHAAGNDDRNFFETRVRPLLIKHCLACHGSKKQESGLRLDTPAGWARGGELGPAIVPGNVKASLLISAIRHEDLKMPKRKLPRAVIDDFVKWVEMGAPDPRDGDGSEPLVAGAKSKIDIEAGRKFWSFQPMAAPQPPPVKYETWVRRPSDRYILAE